MRNLISMMSLSLTVSVACTTPSLAAEKSYLCAIHDVYECVDVKGCNRISSDSEPRRCHGTRRRE